MNQRFFVYPILFLALTQLAPLLRRDRSWFAAQIVQQMLILLACVGGLYFDDQFAWVIVAWGLFAAFVVAPAVLSSVAVKREQHGRWRRAALFRQLAGWATWGQTGQLHRHYAAALRLVAHGHTENGLRLLEEMATQPIPLFAAGLVRTWELSLLVTLRQWERAVAFYETVGDWGTLGLATHARLLVARALAEAGQIDRALRSLQFAALSPRTVGARQAQLWTTRVCVAALAGDPSSLEELLNRREYRRQSRQYSRFAAYWRGRCALARGELETAVRMLTRAFGLTNPRNRLWREAIMQQLRRAEEERMPVTWAAQEAAYAHGRALLERAEQDSALWRALMHLGRPATATLVMLLAMAVVHLVGDIFLRGELRDRLFLLAGNSIDVVKRGEWWRVFTALFLHANLLHLAMNGAGLWIFGSAVEKTMGWWRFLVAFILGGALANLVSASFARYDIAIGASGGVFAVIGAFAVVVWRLRAPMYFALRRRLLITIALMVAADFTIGGLEPQVDNLAHVAGFAAGIALAAVLYRPRATDAHEWSRIRLR